MFSGSHRKGPAMPLTSIFAPMSRVVLALACVGGVAACSSSGPVSGGLEPGLVAQVSTPGAQMDRGSALTIINQYRAVRGASALAADAGLDAQAQALAAQYARTGTPLAKPGDLAAMRLSAGYTNFAETFSGWRNSPADADVLAMGDARRAGFAAVYDPNSAYGTHWVMVLAR